MTAAVGVPSIISFDKLINRKVKANGANVLIEALYCNSVVTVLFFFYLCCLTSLHMTLGLSNLIMCSAVFVWFIQI